MRTFRIFLALTVAGLTFYSLNVLAMKHGYPNRLDFKNRHYSDSNCADKHKHSFRHHNNQNINPIITVPADSIKP